VKSEAKACPAVCHSSPRTPPTATVRALRPVACCNSKLKLNMLRVTDCTHPAGRCGGQTCGVRRCGMGGAGAHRLLPVRVRGHRSELRYGAVATAGALHLHCFCVLRSLPATHRLLWLSLSPHTPHTYTQTPHTYTHTPRTYTPTHPRPSHTPHPHTPPTPPTHTRIPFAHTLCACPLRTP
jgi:hypothetical protein